MRLLVTGANGFLGRALKPLIPPAWDPTGLVRSAGDANVLPRTYVGIEPLLADRAEFDLVLHLAAQIRVPPEGPEAYLSANVELPSRLVRAFPAARHVLASSVSVYAPPGTQPITAATAPDPRSAYGVSKLAGEWVVRLAPSHAVIRFSSLLGVGMHADTFVPRILADARRERRITLSGDGERLQNYLDVRDAAAMCVRALQMASNFVTLGVAPRSLSNRAVADLVARRLGAEVVTQGVDASPSWAYAVTGLVELSENTRPLADTIDWLVAQ
jgi:nucleoside-diphosphate-sugar epimerase